MHKLNVFILWIILQQFWFKGNYRHKNVLVLENSSFHHSTILELGQLGPFLWLQRDVSCLQKIAYEHVSSQFANDGKTRVNAFENPATNDELVAAHAHCFKSDRIRRSPLVNEQIEKSLLYEMICMVIALPDIVIMEDDIKSHILSSLNLIFFSICRLTSIMNLATRLRETKVPSFSETWTSSTPSSKYLPSRSSGQLFKAPLYYL